MTSAVILDLRKEELEREFFEPSRELAELFCSLSVPSESSVCSTNG